MPITKAVEKTEPTNNGEAPASPPEAATATSFLRSGRLRGVIVALGAFLILQPPIIAAVILLRPQSPARTPREIGLGQFRFVAAPDDPGPLRACQFQVTAALNPRWQALAPRLFEERTRLRQAVEELLREARSTDFADPSLRQLRHHLREKLNEVLEVAVVTEVFITDWQPEWGQMAPPSQTAPAGPAESFPPQPTVRL